MAIDALIDTSLFIAHTRQQSGLSKILKAYRTPAVSFVTKFEYEVGEVHAGRKSKFETSFPECTVVALSDLIWQRAADLQIFSISVNARMALADLLIAATASREDVPLLTLNFIHFQHLQKHPFHPLRLPKVP